MTHLAVGLEVCAGPEIEPVTGDVASLTVLPPLGRLQGCRVARAVWQLLCHCCHVGQVGKVVDVPVPAVLVGDVGVSYGVHPHAAASCRNGMDCFYTRDYLSGDQSQKFTSTKTIFHLAVACLSVCMCMLNNIHIHKQKL